MKRIFAIAHDGFVQDARYGTLWDAKEAWQRDIKSRSLYQYDCSVYELNTDGSVLRVVPYAEMFEE